MTCYVHRLDPAIVIIIIIQRPRQARFPAQRRLRLACRLLLLLRILPNNDAAIDLLA